MDKIKNKKAFFDLFETGSPLLKAKFDVNSTKEAITVEIENTLDRKIDPKGLENFKKICTNIELTDLYTKCNGFSLATPVLPGNVIKKPLMRQLPVADLIKFTDQYLPKGELAWTIDLNKTKTLYRSEHKWLAFAEIDGGPTCLTIFLEGENAGNIFLLEPQPHFNTLKPIAKTFNGFLERIAKDPAAFFRLTRAYVTIIGQDGNNFGYVPLQYIHDSDIMFPEKEVKASLEMARSAPQQISNDNLRNKWWKFW
ncbi:hypothetical protein [Mucilaginibacter xinganensis]|uniref:Uncharacterized protein n=1 Tax=Mucilaginibacter xinganensis TaxID=1234841 RepID=A0A223NRK8_9SPHI|nr:hypothetical protein [Mucilaginibacter xinganensis]ASU32111.1 hypothetical protein MuYL_0208 [Mucilaginibacter xinganensis]